MKLTKYIAIIGCATSLFACGAPKNDLTELIDYKQDFREERIHVFLKSFSDHRQGSALNKPTGADVIYSYHPQDVTDGKLVPMLGFYLYNSLEKRNPSVSNAVGIDVSLRDVKTVIHTGDFSSGKYGKYKVAVTAKVILRNMYNNSTLNTFIVNREETKSRTTTTGIKPSAKADETQLRNLVDLVAGELADDILAKTKKSLSKIDYKVSAASPTITETVGEEFLPVDTNKNISNTAEKSKELQKSDDLAVSPDMIDFIEREEELSEHKDYQRKLYEQKVLEQKWLDYLDQQQ